MRSKEDAQDYRYFPDPDLPPLVIEDAWVQRVRNELPELPGAMRARLVADHGVTDYDAQQLTASRDVADYYEAVCKTLPAADAASRKLVANWVLGEFAAALNRFDIAVAEAPVPPARLTELLRRVADGTLSGKMAKDVFDELWSTPQATVDAIVERRGLRQISDSGALEKLVDAAIAANPAVVAEFRSGKERAFNSLVGQVMKASKGKANPAQVSAILKRRLGG
jgi:aspartyl-tRNA(Asn)/glutamyl-tRNA(Gln) amidotransferase subunit B